MLSFPLENVSKQQLLQLGYHLWSWNICDNCKQGQGCTSDDCSSQRADRLERYFEHYKDLTASYEPGDSIGTQPALESHEDLFAIIEALKQQPDQKRCDISASLFSARLGRLPPSAKDCERAMNLAVRVMMMLNCSTEQRSSDLLELSVFQVPWKQNVAFSDFIATAIPRTDHPALNDDSGGPFDIKPLLMAKNLKKRAGLKFTPTDNIRSHLKLDARNGEVQIFHFTAFLKEHLRLTKDVPYNSSLGDVLKLGAIPRQLALETLDTIQTLLFPLNDPPSRSLLQSHVSRSNFDADILRFENTAIRLPSETASSNSYHYFGSRLADLYEEVENPTPRGWAQKWFERRSGARYIMMATLAGVTFAIILGIAGLAVGIYQAWLTYQTWQHPVTLPSSG